MTAINYCFVLKKTTCPETSNFMSCNPQPCFLKLSVPQVCRPVPHLLHGSHWHSQLTAPHYSAWSPVTEPCQESLSQNSQGELSAKEEERLYFFSTVNTTTDSHPPFSYPLQALLSITNTPTKAARITNKKNVHQAQIKTVGCCLAVTQGFMSMKNPVPQQTPALAAK